MRHKTECPKCGTDVMQTGFDLEGSTVEMWMAIGGRLQRITHSEIVGGLSCSQCDAKLDVSMAELIKAVAA